MFPNFQLNRTKDGSERQYHRGTDRVSLQLNNDFFKSSKGRITKINQTPPSSRIERHHSQMPWQRVEMSFYDIVSTI